jgi:hypothetical protein
MKGLIAVPALLLLVASRPALADLTKEECIEANVQGQELRSQSKLSAARDQLRACAAASCPGLVREDCTRRLDELEKVQPTIVFSAKDSAGNDVAGVTVAVDATPAGTLDGSELAVDPGEHVFTFVAPGQPAVSRALVLSIGEKDRREQVIVAGAVAPIARPAAALPPPPPPRARLVVESEEGATIAVDGRMVAVGHFDAGEPPGPHRIVITAAGMQPYKAGIDLRDGETRTLEVSLEAEKRAVLWPWIAGAVAVVGSGIVGGYFLFKSSPAPGPALPPASLGSAQLSVFR